MTARSGLRLLALAAMLSAPLLLGGCAGGGGDDLDAAELGELGGRIYAEPDRAEEILRESGMDRDAFETRVREVSNDPETAREYTEAFDSVVREDANRPVLDSAPADSLAVEGG